MGDIYHNVVLWDLATEKKRSQLRRNDRQMISVAFSPEGQSVATVSTNRHELEIDLWDVASGTAKRKFEIRDGRLLSFDRHLHDAPALAFSADGKLLAFGGCEFARRARLWEVSTGKEIRQFGSDRASIASLGFSPR